MRTNRVWSAGVLGFALAVGALAPRTSAGSDQGVPPPSSGCCRVDLFGLGQAAGYGILVLGGKFVMSGGSRLAGDLGAAAGSAGDVSGGSFIDGTAFRGLGASIQFTGGAAAAGGTELALLGGAVTEATSASAYLASLPATQTFGALRPKGLTIVGNGGENVVSVGSVRLAGGNTLTIRGTANDTFVFNVKGSFVFSGGGRLVLQGIAPDQILWNFPNGGKVDFSGSARDPQGTFLNPKGEISIGPVNLIGTAIARSVLLHSGGRVSFPSPPCDGGFSKQQ